MIAEPKLCPKEQHYLLLNWLMASKHSASPIDFVRQSGGSLILSVIKTICRLYVLYVVEISKAIYIHEN